MGAISLVKALVLGYLVPMGGWSVKKELTTQGVDMFYFYMFVKSMCRI